MSFLFEYREEGGVTTDFDDFETDTTMTLAGLAASQGHVHLLKYMDKIERRSSIQNCEMMNFNHPLYFAVKFGHVEAAEYLREVLEQFDDYNWEFGFKFICRRCAVKAVLQQEPDTLRYFMEGGCLNPREDVASHFDNLQYSMENYYPHPSDWEEGSSLQRIHELVWSRLNWNGEGDVTKKEEIDKILNFM